MKLSKRLQAISNLVEPNYYAHIWDCCCDHGLLGFYLYQQQMAHTIHFVDVLAHLIEDIDQQLIQQARNPALSDSSSVCRAITHCLDVSDLPLSVYQGKQLVIIAGVGGDLMSRMISAIHQRLLSQGLEVDFLLCPVHRQYRLRNTLIELGFRLKKEKLVEDNKRIYEVLLLSSAPMSSISHVNAAETDDDDAPKNAINPIGEQFWQTHSVDDTRIAKRYLHSRLQYYRQVQQGGRSDVDDIIRAYEALSDDNS